MTSSAAEGFGAVNRIEAIRTPSKYVPEAHLVIALDGVPLDVALGVEGLVSSLLGWFHDDADCADIYESATDVEAKGVLRSGW
jgi:hypothetical protein